MEFLNPYEAIFERLDAIEATLKQVAERQPTTTPQPVIMTGEQIQEKFNITRQTLARWRASKRIPAMQVGSIIRYDLNKVVEALEKRGGR